MQDTPPLSPQSSAPSTIRDRDPYLDLLRAIACLMVIVYHLFDLSPIDFPRIKSITVYGSYGVDLFFVLSGWLIGGLYWRELHRFGNVCLSGFLPRRWIRTIPPYFAGLILSWAAVRYERGQAFDYGYLIFIQNYYAVIPFFLVSWSLCIEEHFYLFLPLGLRVCQSIKFAPEWFFVTLLVIAPIGRLFASRNGLPDHFGFTLAATHLRLEGLVLGFWAAKLPVMNPAAWLKLKRWSSRLLPVCVVGLAILPCFSDLVRYRAGLSILAISLTGIVIFLVGRRPLWIARLAATRWIALTSYSVYLTHVLMFHIALTVLNKMSSVPRATFFPLGLALTAAGGFAFYWLIERGSLILRDRLSPRRRV